VSVNTLILLLLILCCIQKESKEQTKTLDSKTALAELGDAFQRAVAHLHQDDDDFNDDLKAKAAARVVVAFQKLVDSPESTKFVRGKLDEKLQLERHRGEMRTAAAMSEKAVLFCWR
jgi:hypothetical protein